MSTTITDTFFFTLQIKTELDHVKDSKDFTTVTTYILSQLFNNNLSLQERKLKFFKFLNLTKNLIHNEINNQFLPKSLKYLREFNNNNKQISLKNTDNTGKKLNYFVENLVNLNLIITNSLNYQLV